MTLRRPRALLSAAEASGCWAALVYQQTATRFVQLACDLHGGLRRTLLRFEPLAHEADVHAQDVRLIRER